jgi:hypothetical protein
VGLYYYHKWYCVVLPALFAWIKEPLEPRPMRAANVAIVVLVVFMTVAPSCKQSEDKSKPGLSTGNTSQTRSAIGEKEESTQTDANNNYKPIKQGTCWALLIGVDRYQDLKFPKLSYCGSDAIALREVLINQANFPRDHVIVMQNKEEIDERRPARLAIKRLLDAILPQARPEDMVLISFSGHGVHVNGTRSGFKTV